MKKKILLLDSKISNIKSVCNALDYLKIQYSITDSEFNAKNYDYLILPGVGHYGKFVQNIKKQNLHKSIKNFIDSDKFFLGICVGMQFMFHSSEESENNFGLNLINERVKKFQYSKITGKIPLIGKYKIKKNNLDWSKTILNNFNESEQMYFLHSYYCLADKRYELSQTTYNNFNFTSSIKIGNKYGVQFHPEKSGMDGLKIFENFIALK